MIDSLAPDFSLRDQNNQEVALSGFRGSPVLLVFYPFAFTGICQGELTWVRDNLPPAAEVLAISVDSVFAHKVWADREGYEFPLLADFWPHGEVARSYGVFNEKIGAANRGTFLVDRDGIIRYAQMNGPGEPRDDNVWREALSFA
ncbi:peroxiredoxin AhpE [Virgisporangium ochraceum]|uniref:Alkyl hydroperoxide reductase E n=1 Tax=Virgisporangium ochraceum TaxID=65505 RepID=A0A8J3ZSM9_9ACTN|nr:peroxiredoxin [Virgisporangium ochraceum]GIJ68283.1 putative peroxiredoxin [Virgisporangium ochraceum]